MAPALPNTSAFRRIWRSARPRRRNWTASRRASNIASESRHATTLRDHARAAPLHGAALTRRIRQPKPHSRPSPRRRARRQSPRRIRRRSTPRGRTRTPCGPTARISAGSTCAPMPGSTAQASTATRARAAPRARAMATATRATHPSASATWGSRRRPRRGAVLTSPLATWRPLPRAPRTSSRCARATRWDAAPGRRRRRPVRSPTCPISSTRIRRSRCRPPRAPTTSSSSGLPPATTASPSRTTIWTGAAPARSQPSRTRTPTTRTTASTGPTPSSARRRTALPSTRRSCGRSSWWTPPKTARRTAAAFTRAASSSTRRTTSTSVRATRRGAAPGPRSPTVAIGGMRARGRSPYPIVSTRHASSPTRCSSSSGRRRRIRRLSALTSETGWISAGRCRVRRHSAAYRRSRGTSSTPRGAPATS